MCHGTDLARLAVRRQWRLLQPIGFDITIVNPPATIKTATYPWKLLRTQDSTLQFSSPSLGAIHQHRQAART